MNPVSVVIPVRNGERYIAEAIESVLSQGTVVGEVVVVDDGSTDATVLRVQSFEDKRVRLLLRPAGQQGVSAVRNFGFSQIAGDWVMFLDADDRLRHGTLNLLHAAAKASDAVAVYGDYERIDETGTKIGRRDLIRKREKPSGAVLENLLGSNFIVNGGIMLVRASAFRAMGGFDETLSYAEDWHGWCRLAARGPFLYLPGTHVLDYRVHTNSVMMNKLLTYDDCLPALKRVFADPEIIVAVDAPRLEQLRHKAETHMNAYTVGQAVRSRRYGKAFAALLDTFIHRPRQGVRAMIFTAAALAGI